MTNREMFQWLEQLSTDENFKSCAALTSRQLEERYDLELVLRFMILKELQGDQLKFEDIGEFLTERMLEIASGSTPLDLEVSGEAFRRTFAALVNSGLGDDAFRKYDVTKGRFLGSFSISSFEAVAIGLGSRFSNNPNAADPVNLTNAVESLWTTDEFTTYSGSGIRANLRVPHVVPLGRALFG